MTGLGDFLAAAAHRRRAPGEWDCCAFPAAWAMACGHADPMAEWRGRYRSEAAGEQLADDAGGLAALFDRALSGAGLERVDPSNVREGDIAVVTLLGKEAGAVYTGRRWAFVAGRGLGFASLDPTFTQAAWRPAPWEKP